MAKCFLWVLGLLQIVHSVYAIGLCLNITLSYPSLCYNDLVLLSMLSILYEQSGRQRVSLSLEKCILDPFIYLLITVLRLAYTSNYFHLNQSSLRIKANFHMELVSKTKRKKGTTTNHIIPLFHYNVTYNIEKVSNFLFLINPEICISRTTRCYFVLNKNGQLIQSNT